MPVLMECKSKRRHERRIKTSSFVEATKIEAKNNDIE